MLTNTIYPPIHHLQLYVQYRWSYATIFGAIEGGNAAIVYLLKSWGGRLAGGEVNGQIVPVVK